MADTKDESTNCTTGTVVTSPADDSLIFKNIEQFTTSLSDSTVSRAFAKLFDIASLYTFILQSHAASSTQANPPSILDFNIVKPISKGAFGKVFLGYKNTKPSLLYAIKVNNSSSPYRIHSTSPISGDEEVGDDKQEYGVASHNRTKRFGSFPVTILRSALLLIAKLDLGLSGDGVYGRRRLEITTCHVRILR